MKEFICLMRSNTIYGSKRGRHYAFLSLTINFLTTKNALINHIKYDEQRQIRGGSSIAPESIDYKS